MANQRTPRLARRRRRWGFARVHGDSMQPALAPGDRVWVTYGARPRPGDVVIARFPDGTLAIKRVHEARALPDGRAGWWLLSDHAAEGIDSRHRGAISDEAVLGVVRRRVWPRPGRIS